MNRKNNRLAKENYATNNCYYLTIACFNRAEHFRNEKLINLCLTELKKLIGDFETKIWAYCFMPNHLHLLIETNKCSKFIKLFKQKTGYHFKSQSKNILWQKGYYDHILRRDEDLMGTTAYIFNNPVRAKIANDYLGYPFSGSFEFDRSHFMED